VRFVLYTVGGLAGLVALFIVWRLYATIAGGRRAYRVRMARIAPVIEALDAGRDPGEADLVTFARDRRTRQVLYDALEHHDKLALFPKEFLTWDAFAEADLVGWLGHPNELGAAPDEIELMATLPAPRAQGHYFLFRYRTLAPHWAAGDGWMAGVAGPYDLTAVPRPFGPGTFSRFEAYDSRTPEEHVEVTHRVVVERRSDSSRGAS
jgi:hypothetical protein